MTSALKTKLRIVLVYYFICTTSAILWPASWYIAAGLPLPDSVAPVRAVGAAMFALFTASALALRNPFDSQSPLKILLAANVADALVTATDIFLGNLPPQRGAIFVVVAVVMGSIIVSCLSQSTAHKKISY